MIFNDPKAVVPPMVPDSVRPPSPSVSPARIVKLPVLSPLSIVLENDMAPSLLPSVSSLSIVTVPSINTGPVKVISVTEASEDAISP